MDDPQTIYLMCDQPPTCGKCGSRVYLNDQPVDHDADGPIYSGECVSGHVAHYQDDNEA